MIWQYVHHLQCTMYTVCILVILIAILFFGKLLRLLLYYCNDVFMSIHIEQTLCLKGLQRSAYVRSDASVRHATHSVVPHCAKETDVSFSTVWFSNYFVNIADCAPCQNISLSLSFQKLLFFFSFSFFTPSTASQDIVPQ